MAGGFPLLKPRGDRKPSSFEARAEGTRAGGKVAHYGVTGRVHRAEILRLLPELIQLFRQRLDLRLRVVTVDVSLLGFLQRSIMVHARLFGLRLRGIAGLPRLHHLSSRHVALVVESPGVLLRIGGPLLRLAEGVALAFLQFWSFGLEGLALRFTGVLGLLVELPLEGVAFLREDFVHLALELSLPTI